MKELCYEKRRIVSDLLSAVGGMFLDRYYRKCMQLQVGETCSENFESSQYTVGVMMESVSLKYGSEHLALDIPETATRLSFREPEYDIKHEDFIARLDALIGEKDICGQVAIVVADKTRLCGYGQILPWVVDVLQKRNVRPSHITFFIAYGTHPRQLDEECLQAYGEVFENYTFIHHDCHDATAFRLLGETSCGTPVLVRHELCEAALVLTIGAVSHHYFAGYGGGRKLIFPGLGERAAIYANHRLFLDAERGALSPGCQPGNLVANPLADDLEEMHTMLPPYVSIHGILDSRGKVARFTFGCSYEDFKSVCRELDSCYQIEAQQPYDLVIGSAGGFPKDINFIQVHKSVHNAATLVQEGGTLIIFAECRDGIGSKTFLPYFEMGGWQQTFAHLTANYAGNGGTALAMMEKTNRIRVKLVTDLPLEICEKIGVEKISAAEAGELTRATMGRIAVIENASLLVAKKR
jgi:nickel-dependent lactate racemase